MLEPAGASAIQAKIKLARIFAHKNLSQRYLRGTHGDETTTRRYFGAAIAWAARADTGVKSASGFF